MDSRRTLQRRTIRSGVVDLAPGHPINDLRIPGAFALLFVSALLFLLCSFFLGKLLGINLLLQGISLRLKRIELTDRMPKSYSHLASSKTHSKRNSTAGHDKRPLTCKGGQRPTPNYHNGKHRERHIELQDEYLRKKVSDAPRSQANNHNASQLLPVYPTFALTIRPLELASE